MMFVFIKSCSEVIYVAVIFISCYKATRFAKFETLTNLQNLDSAKITRNMIILLSKTQHLVFPFNSSE